MKYSINATDEQLEKLYKSLHVGSPLDTALIYSGIAKSTYYFWVATASVVKYVREEEFIRIQNSDVESGISFAAIKEKVMEENKTRESSLGIGGFVEPKPETILKYKTDKNYKQYADKICDIIEKCDMMRSEIVMYHLGCIRDSAKQRGMNAMSSQWFLERACPNDFSRMNPNETKNKDVVEPVSVKFVDPAKQDARERVKNMEAIILSETKVDGLS